MTFGSRSFDFVGRDLREPKATLLCPRAMDPGRLPCVSIQVSQIHLFTRFRAILAWANGPKNYRPFSPNPSVAIHTDSHEKTYKLGICKIKTSLGHLVECYDMERTICDIIKNSQKIDAEIYGKALRLYAKSKDKNTRNLLHYAQILKIENKVAELMTVVLNED